MTRRLTTRISYYIIIYIYDYIFHLLSSKCLNHNSYLSYIIYYFFPMFLYFHVSHLRPPRLGVPRLGDATLGPGFRFATGDVVAVLTGGLGVRWQLVAHLLDVAIQTLILLPVLWKELKIGGKFWKFPKPIGRPNVRRGGDYIYNGYISAILYRQEGISFTLCEFCMPVDKTLCFFSSSCWCKNSACMIDNYRLDKWGFPKMVVPPNHPF